MAERTALLVDGANMFMAAKALRMSIDYGKLLRILRQDFNIVRANYYTAKVEGPNDQLKPLTDWLGFNGYRIVSKPTREYARDDGSVRVKGNMDVHITCDVLTMTGRIDHFILASGDGDFEYLVDTLHRQGLSVSVLSTNETDPPFVAWSLRQAADEFIELSKLRDLIERER